MKMKITFLFFIISLLSFIPANAQDPLGCFLEGFQKKNAVFPTYENHNQVEVFPTVTVTIDCTDTLAKVSKYIYGNNANPYMTQIVTEPVLLGHIKKLSPNIIRFPGGNLSSIFFWNSPKDQPPADAPSMIAGSDGILANAGYWYGKNTESWTLSVDNYYKLLTQASSTGMITVNYGYARYGTGPAPVTTAAHYAADWVRYDNGRTKYWEIGNESNGTWQAGYRINRLVNQDGQPDTISGSLYGEHFKIFADSMRAAASAKGNQIFIGAQLMANDATNSWNPPDRTWNQGFFSKAGNAADFFIIHSYYTPYNENSSPSVILGTGQTETKNMMDFLKANTSSNGVEMKPVALTEWNIFATGSKQMCSYINGMHAALVLGELIKQEYGQASRWDLANGYSGGNDHGLFNNKDEPGVPDWNPRPAFFYMYYFQKYFGNHLLKSTVTGNQSIVCYASSFSSGEIGVVIINKGTTGEVIKFDIPGFGYGNRFYMHTLRGGTDNGSFSQKVYVNNQPPDNLTGGPINDLSYLKAWSDVIKRPVTIYSPAYSVQYVLIDNGTNVIDNVSENETIKPIIYPNPATRGITVTSPLFIDKIEIIGLNGTIIETVFPEKTDNLVPLDLSIPNGIYLIKVYNGSRSSVEKLVVMK